MKALRSGTWSTLTATRAFCIALLILFWTPALSAQLGVEITTNSLPKGIVGVGYSEELTATGGILPHTWSIISGSLPAGLTLSPFSGVISGTPTAVGKADFRVRVTTAALQNDEKNLSIDIDPALVITTPSLASGVVGSPYSQGLSATGGNTPYTWSLASGTLPAGLTLSGATIGGNPTTAGTSNITIRVTDKDAGQTAQKAFSIVIAAPPPSITTGSLPAGQVGTAYSQGLSATGGTPPFTWSIVSGSLPAGLSVTGSTIGGTPSAAGVSNFTVQARDSGSPAQIAQKAFTISITPAPLSVTTSSLSSGMVGTAYSQNLNATGGTGPYQWTVTVGSLPAGLTITGLAITGTPTAAGTSNFTVQVMDSASTPQTSVRPLSIVIFPAVIALATTSFPDVIAGASYSQTLTATGGTTPYRWSIASGSLPAGLALNNATIGGSPTTPGTSNFTVRLEDSGSPPQVVQKAFSILVIAPLVITTTSPLPAGTVGAAYGVNLFASGGTPGYTWSVTSGTLPPGITLSGSTLGGTPTTAGGFGFTVRVTDAGGSQQSATRAFTVTIGATVTIVTASPLPPGFVGSAYSQPVSASGGTLEFQWSVTGGQLPAGITVSAAGLISGTPTTEGTANFTLRATDTAGRSASKTFDLRIDARLSVTTTTLPAGTVGAAYSRQLESSSTGSLTWSVTAGSLPAGLSMTPGGLIGGTPSTAGTFTFTVQVSGGAPVQTSSRPLQIVVNPALTITTAAALPAGSQFVPYSTTLNATGGVTPYTWSITAGAPPAGLALGSTSGTLSGTPTEMGAFSFTAQVRDTGTGAVATRGFTLSIQPGSLRITTLSLPPGIQGFSYSQQLQAAGGPTPYTWSILSGSLPSGLVMTPAGVVQGTPPTTGSSTIRVRVIDASGANDTRDLPVAVGPPVGPLSLTGVQSTVSPAQQLPLVLSLSAPYPIAISGTLNLTFTPGVTGPANDPAVQFSTGGRTVTFTFPANTVSAVFPSQMVVMTGTVAGTITISGGLQNGPPSAQLASTAVRSIAPQFTSVAASRAGGLRVQITGYSPERRVTNVDFGFDVRTTSGVQRVNLTRPVESDFNTWYQSQGSAAFGSAFLFEQLFNVQGDASAIEAVIITLTNGQGNTTSSRVVVSP